MRTKKKGSAAVRWPKNNAENKQPALNKKRLCAPKRFNQKKTAAALGRAKEKLMIEKRFSIKERICPEQTKHAPVNTRISP